MKLRYVLFGLAIVSFLFSSSQCHALTTVEETDFSYHTGSGGSWSTNSNGSNHGGTSKFDNGTLDDWALYTFTGDSVTVYGMKNADCGNVEIYIDDELQATVDTYNGSLIYQQNFGTYTVNNITEHELKLYNPHTKNGSATNYHISVDYITYDESTATPLPTSTPTNTPVPTSQTYISIQEPDRTLFSDMHNFIIFDSFLFWALIIAGLFIWQWQRGKRL